MKDTFSSRILAVGLMVTLLAGCTLSTAKKEDIDMETINSFETELENLRQQLKIPGMSAAVVKNGQVVWARGFGYADIENNIPAAPETTYPLASVTKPFAALVVMQLVQEGKISLVDPISRFGLSLPEGDKAAVHHLMSHTSAGIPGTQFQYDGARYGLLGQVIQDVTGRSLQELLFERILQPLNMDSTAPRPEYCAGLAFASTCERVSKALAKPYQLDENLEFVPSINNPGFGAAAGLMSSVIDLARLDAALDANALVTADTKELMFKPAVSNSGKALPYGLGWFTQRYHDDRFIWHYGLDPPSTSALFLKLPEAGLTFIVLANDDMLSLPFNLGAGNVLDSLLGLEFYKHFILAKRLGQPLPPIEWSSDQSGVQARIDRTQDGALREFLKKEFQAQRMVARTLEKVKRQAHLLAVRCTKARELAASIDPKILNSYIGEYEIEQPKMSIKVLQTETGLHLQGTGLPPFELFPITETNFFIVIGNSLRNVKFIVDEQEQVTGLVVTQNGQSFMAKRK